MAASPRNMVKTLYSKLQSQYKPESALLPKEREIMEHLIFAAFLENTPAKTAFSAFETLEDYFIDWNEIRVTTTSELADVLAALPFAQRVAERLRRTLQWVFDTTYKFDLEEWRRKDAKEFSAFWETNPFGTRFMRDYVLHYAFGSSVIPLDEGALRVMRLLDLTKIDSENREIVRGMERTFSRADGELFFTLLHQLGVEMMAEPVPKKTAKFLKGVDPESEQRSFLPLVETNDGKDPAQIAREMAALKQPKRPKPPTMIDLDDSDLLDETAEDEFIVEAQEEETSEMTVIFESVSDEGRELDSEKKPEAGKRSKKSKPSSKAESVQALEEKKVAAAKAPKKSKPVAEKPKKSKSESVPVKETVSAEGKSPDKKAAKPVKESKPAAKEKKPTKESKPAEKSVKSAVEKPKKLKSDPAPAKEKAPAAEKSSAVKGASGKKAKKTESAPKGDSSLKGGKGRKPPEKAVSRPPDAKGKSSAEKSLKAKSKKSQSKKPR